jgi:trehalose-phosphatase
VQSWSALADTVKSVLNDYPRLKLTQGRMVFEVRPRIKWDKGKALEFLLESLGLADCADVLPVYIGDDRTDEDAFKALRRRGQGVGILVSKYPKETSASYSLQEPAEASFFFIFILLLLFFAVILCCYYLVLTQLCTSRYCSFLLIQVMEFLLRLTKSRPKW